jgi:hypothetical protein
MSTVIGRVAVKVIPDTKDFRRQLERDLREIERTTKVDIRVNIDTSDVTRQAREASAQAQRNLKDIKIHVDLDNGDAVQRAIAKIDRELEKLREIEIEVEANEESLRELRDDLERVLNQVKSVKIKVDEADPASVRKAIESINAEIRKLDEAEIEVRFDKVSLEGLRDELTNKLNEAYDKVQENVQQRLNNIKVHPLLDDSQVREALRQLERDFEKLENLKSKLTVELDNESRRQVEREIEDLEDKIDKIKSTIDVDVVSAAARAELAVLARNRVVELIVKVNEKSLVVAGTALAGLSGARLLGDYIDNIGTSLSNLDKNLPKITTLVLGLASIGSAALTASSNVLAMVSSLASIGPAALALPGILGGMAIGVGVMVAALKDFNTVFPDVKKSFSEMQDLISKNFFAEAEGPLRSMLDVLLPQLSSGFASTATALGKFFGGFADGVKGLLVDELASMFEDLAESIEIATSGTDAMVGVITTLGSVGAGYLPRLAQWFVDITTEFDTFLSKAAADGRLQGWIDTGVAALKDLGSSLGSIGGIFLALGDAAEQAGGSTLAVFADTLDRIQATVETPAFQTGLIQAFTGAHQAIDLIARTSGPALTNFFTSFASTLQTILPMAGEAIGVLVKALADAMATPAFQGSLVAMFTGLKNGIDALVPAIEPMVTAFGSIMEIVGTLAESIGPVLGAAFAYLSDTLVILTPMIQDLITYLGEKLLAAVNIIGPAIVALAGFFAEHETTAKLLAIAIGTTMVGAYIAAQIAATVAAAKIIVANVSLVASIIGMVATFLLQSYIWIAQWVIMATAATVNAAKIVAQWLLTNTAGAVVAVASATAAAVAYIAQWVLLAARSAANAALIVASWLLTNTAGAAVAVARATAAVVAYIAQWVLLAARSAASAALVVAAWLLTNVAGAAVATAAAVAAVARYVAAWVLLGTQAMIRGAMVAAAWLLALGPIGIIVAAVAVAVVLIIRYWDQIKSAFQTGVRAVIGFVQELPGKIKGFFSDAGSWLVGAGSKIIDGLLSGIRAGFDKVKGALGSLTSMLPDWKGPPKKDATLLVGAGQLIIDGLIKGLESRYGAVRKSLSGLTDDIAGETFTTPGIGTSGVRAGVGSGLGTQVAGTEAGSGGVTKILNYYAAPGSSVSSEDDLFAAASRTRMVGW